MISCLNCNSNSWKKFTSIEKGKYDKLIKILKQYETLYPFVKFKKFLIKILGYLGVKNTIKKILKNK